MNSESSDSTATPKSNDKVPEIVKKRLRSISPRVRKEILGKLLSK